MEFCAVFNTLMGGKGEVLYKRQLIKCCNLCPWGWCILFQETESTQWKDETNHTSQHILEYSNIKFYPLGHVELTRSTSGGAGQTNGLLTVKGIKSQKLEKWETMSSGIFRNSSMGEVEFIPTYVSEPPRTVALWSWSNVKNKEPTWLPNSRTFYYLSSVTHTKDFWQFPRSTQNWNEMLSPRSPKFPDSQVHACRFIPFPAQSLTHLYFLEAEEREGNLFPGNRLLLSLPFVQKVLLVLVNSSHSGVVSIFP